MGLGKQAKTLSKGQVEAVLGYLAKTRWPTRNRVIFLLSVKAGLRAKEIARLTWRMVTDARGQIGQAIHLENTASKGQSGRVVPMSDELRTALSRVRPDRRDSQRQLPDRKRAFGRNVGPSRSEPVLAMVSAHRLRRLLQSQRSAHLHHQYRKEDLDGGRVAAGRPDACRTHEPSDHATIHRCQPRSAGENRGVTLGRPKNSERSTDVRFNAHSGLKLDVTALPKCAKTGISLSGHLSGSVV